MNNILKYFGETTNIYESISPFYYYLKFFGLASYSLNFKNGQIMTSFISYIMNFSFVVLYLLFFGNFLLVDESTYLPEGKPILIYGFMFAYSFQYIIISFILIYNFLKRKNVEKFLKLLKTFDDHTDKMGWKFKVNHERVYWTSIFWFFLQFILLSVAYVLQMAWVAAVEHVLKDFIEMFCYCIITNTFILCSLQFIFGVHCVESRFKILNKNARLFDNLR